MSSVEVSLYDDSCIFQWKEQRNATSSEIEAGWKTLGRLSAGLRGFYIIADLSAARRPNSTAAAQLAAQIAPLQDRMRHLAVYAGEDKSVRIALEFMLARTDIRSYSVHATREQAMETIMSHRRRGRTKAEIARVVVRHLLEVQRHECSITDDVIEREQDESLKEILTGVMCLSEGLKCQPALSLRDEATAEVLTNYMAADQEDMEETAQQSLERIVDVAPDPMVVLQLPEDVVVDCSKTFVELLGFDKQDILGQRLLELVELESMDEASTEGLRSLVTSGVARDLKLEFCDSDGNPVELTVNAAPIEDDQGDGALIGSCVIGRQIAHLPAIETANVENTDSIRVKDEVEEWACLASHDLQEPLRRVAAYVQKLDRRYAAMLDTTGREYLGYIMDSVDSMQRLVGGVLDYARIGPNAQPLREIGAGEPLREALQILRGAIEDADAQILYGELPVVMGDQPQLVQLFQNLVGNALRYRETSSSRVCVSISARRCGSEWEFSVRDNGQGMSPEQRNRVFEVFGNPVADETKGGTGLGLAIAKRVVDRHGGRIWVESEPGFGTTIFFTLAAPTTNGSAVNGSNGRYIKTTQPISESTASEALRRLRADLINQECADVNLR